MVGGQWGIRQEGPHSTQVLQLAFCPLPLYVAAVVNDEVEMRNDNAGHVERKHKKKEKVRE